MSIQDVLDKAPREFNFGHNGVASIYFSLPGFGWGEIQFRKNPDGTVSCANEMMSKKTLKWILSELVDGCVLDDPKDDPQDEPQKSQPDS